MCVCVCVHARVCAQQCTLLGFLLSNYWEKELIRSNNKTMNVCYHPSSAVQSYRQEPQITHPALEPYSREDDDVSLLSLGMSEYMNTCCKVLDW